MILSNYAAYDLFYEKYKKEFVVGRKTFLQILEWISRKYEFTEVPVQSISQINVSIFKKNCENVTGVNVCFADTIKAYRLMNAQISNRKEEWFVIDANTCYMESNCPLFDAEYYIALGIEKENISKYTDALIVYLNYFNMRDTLLMK